MLSAVLRDKPQVRRRGGGLMSEQSDGDFIADYLKARKEEEKRELDASAKRLSEFADFAQTKGVHLTRESFSYTPVTGLLASSPGIVSRLLHGFRTERDGLYSFSGLMNNVACHPFQGGLFRADQFILLAHPHFRRGYHGLNNYAPLFVDLFWKFNEPRVSRFIALDEDRVRVNLDNRMYMELDTWYGAPFSSRVEDIPSGVSKLRPPLDIDPCYISTFFGGAYCLDVKWSRDGSIKTFQALELKDETVKMDINGEDFHPARYVHAEFDMTTGVLRHFDGAMQYYSQPEY
jgi:hypothetical protein